MARTLPRKVADKIPLLGTLSQWVARIASERRGNTPVGLVKLLPLAIAIDIINALDWSVPVVGPAVMFVVETAFVLGLTGNTGYAIGFAGLDLIPFVDVVPFATLTVLAEMRKAWKQGSDAPTPPAGSGPIIDV